MTDSTRRDVLAAAAAGLLALVVPTAWLRTRDLEELETWNGVPVEGGPLELEVSWDPPVMLRLEGLAGDQPIKVDLEVFTETLEDGRLRASARYLAPTNMTLQAIGLVVEGKLARRRAVSPVNMTPADSLTVIYDVELV